MRGLPRLQVRSPGLSSNSAAHVLRAVAEKSHPPASLPDFHSELHFVYAYTSKPERMLEWPERALRTETFVP